MDGIVPFAQREKIAMRLAYVPQVAPQLGASLGEVVAAVVKLRQIERALVEAHAARLGLLLDGQPAQAVSRAVRRDEAEGLIALALASRPSLVILDEPTASLDRAARTRFWEMLDEVAPTATVLLCSHRAEEVSGFVERQVEMLDGRMVRDSLSPSPSGVVQAVPIVRNDPYPPEGDSYMTRRKVLATLVPVAIVTALALGVAALAGVFEPTVSGPQPIVWDHETCAECGMHIGNPAYAAQIQTREGRVLNFDDPGCLLLYVAREHPTRSRCIFTT